MSGSGSVWNSTTFAQCSPVASSSNPATVSHRRSGSPGNATVCVSSQPTNRNRSPKPGNSQRRKPTGSSFAANRAAWSKSFISGEQHPLRFVRLDPHRHPEQVEGPCRRLTAARLSHDVLLAQQERFDLVRERVGG